MQIKYINVPCESLSLSSGFFIACLPKIFKCCVTVSTFSNNVEKKKVMVMVVKALTPRETTYSFTLKCSTKLLFVLIEFSCLCFSFSALPSHGEFGMLPRFPPVPVRALRPGVHGVRPGHAPVSPALPASVQRVLQAHGDVRGLLA